jgi:hypothetical protein
LLPDRIQAQLELHDLTSSLERQGITLDNPWRATWIALGARGVARYFLAEILTLAPGAAFVVGAALHLRLPQFAWVPVIALAWKTRAGQTSCLGCVLSCVVPLAVAGVIATFDRSVLSLLGAICVPWTWWVGAYTRQLQKNAVIAGLANNPELYGRLRAARAVAGPEHADVQVTIRRSDQIDPG